MIETMNRDHTTTMRDIMMRLQSCDRSAYMQPLFDQSERVSSVVHTRNRSHGVMNPAAPAPHHTIHVRCAGSAVHALAASVTDPRALHLAPLALCALLPTLPRRWCTTRSTPEQTRGLSVSYTHSMSFD